MVWDEELKPFSFHSVYWILVILFTIHWIFTFITICFLAMLICSINLAFVLYNKLWLGHRELWGSSSLGLETPNASSVIHPGSLLLDSEGSPHLALLICTVGLSLLIVLLSVLWITHTLWITLTFLYFQYHTWVNFNLFLLFSAQFAFLCLHVCSHSLAFLHPKFVC